MKFFALLTICFLALVSPAQAEDKVAVVAVVGNEAITNHDVINKLKITLISSGIEGSPENITKLRPQIVQNLINEKVQITEADRLNLKTSDEEIHEALKTLETQNGMEAGGLRKLLGQNNIPTSTMNNQIKAEIAWAKIKSGAIRNKAKVSDDEVDVFLRSQNVNSERNEYYLHEIVIPVEKSNEEEQALNLALALQEQINAGKKFAAVAQEVSGGATAKTGGEIGWLAENNVPREILAELKNLKANQTSNPIRSIEGYFLVKYSKTRVVQKNSNETLVDLKKFSAPINNLKNKAMLAKAQEKLSSLSDRFRSCTDGARYSLEKGVSFSNLGQTKFGALPNPVRSILNNTGVGEISTPRVMGNEVVAFVICERIEELFPELNQEARKKAEDFLLRRKIELQARKYLRDLRAKTNIEIR